MRAVALLVGLAACGGSRSDGAATSAAPDRGPEAKPTVEPEMTAQPVPLAMPTPGPAVAPVTPMPAPGALVVVAKITDAGPIGDGRCSQRSYQIAIERVVSGAPPAEGTPWVHFERCQGAPEVTAPAGDVAGTGLAVGTTYQISLQKGASKNFGDGFMIVGAHPP